VLDDVGHRTVGAVQQQLPLEQRAVERPLSEHLALHRPGRSSIGAE